MPMPLTIRSCKGFRPSSFRTWFNLLCMASANDGKLAGDRGDMAYKLRVKEGGLRSASRRSKTPGFWTKMKRASVRIIGTRDNSSPDVSTDQ